jgi:hypothetical protein
MQNIFVLNVRRKVWVCISSGKTISGILYLFLIDFSNTRFHHLYIISL